MPICKHSACKTCGFRGLSSQQVKNLHLLKAQCEPVGDYSYWSISKVISLPDVLSDLRSAACIAWLPL